MSDKFIKLSSTFFNIGYSPFAPGTAASAAGALIAILLQNHPLLYIVLFIVITRIGFLVSGKMEELEGKKDPGCVVIDEISGIMISFFLIPITWPTVVITFFLFRAFDMFKIYPANKLEDMGGARGIMMDDIMAGVYTNIVMQIAVRWAGVI
ncbi:Phosphatidylglycerophosphatase A [hydrothermal vent metagenome]|uniref:Phosphatidylglycerophosphatase A n=1 Tax=hydrothermal vent metagenome TaxID=652676 RepID=A0A3B1DN56_9ZZZZ